MEAQTTPTSTSEVKPEQKILNTRDHLSVCRSKKILVATLVAGMFLIILASFAVGVAVGIHKAKFSYAFGQNYERNFVGPNDEAGRPGMPGPGGPGMIGNLQRGMNNLKQEFSGSGFRNAHGTAGTIISINGNDVVVRDRENKENNVAVNDQTMIKNRQSDLKISDLKVNDQVVVIGQPGDNGVINASLIRVFNGQTSTNAGDNPTNPTNNTTN